MMRVIEDDKTVYGPSLNQFPQELNVGHLSAGTLWTLYKMDLKMALEGAFCYSKPEKMPMFDFLDYMMRVIEDDKTVYGPSLNQFPQELNVGHLSAGTLWTLYKMDLKMALEGGFIPFVMDWLNENDEHSMDILRNAYNSSPSGTKPDNFPQTSDHTRFSNSVVDVFTQLNEALKLLKQMDCPNPVVYADMMKRFSKTLNKSSMSLNCSVITLLFRLEWYFVKSKSQFAEVQLEKIYETMGGQELDPTCSQVLTNLQKKLNSVLDKLSGQFVATLEPMIHEQTNKLGVLLSKIKGPQLQKTQVAAEVDAVLEPLMDLLEGSLQRYFQQCEKTVLKYILKELWRITIVSMEKLVVLPPLADKT
ncbi:hypothetical protein OSTOST_06227, partial [Ostertagia ostertagi]